MLDLVVLLSLLYIGYNYKYWWFAPAIIPITSSKFSTLRTWFSVYNWCYFCFSLLDCGVSVPISNAMLDLKLRSLLYISYNYKYCWLLPTVSTVGRPMSVFQMSNLSTTHYIIYKSRYLIYSRYNTKQGKIQKQRYRKPFILQN